MPYVEFACRPTIIGSVPHIDPVAACAMISRHIKDFPAWPQLPNRSFLENMYAQYSEGFPGIVIEGLSEETASRDGRIYVDRSQDSTEGLQRLYTAYLENRPDDYQISPEYAAGLHHFLSLSNLSPLGVKGHVTGPMSWGLTVCDQDRRAIIYDDTLADAAAKLLRLKAAWQEKQLSNVGRNTIIFLDEPYMSSFGSAFVTVSKEKVVTLVEEVLGGITGFKGIHCCGNTDWSVLLGTGLDILSFDAYNYAASLALYPREVTRFLQRSGTVAWGIIPNTSDALAGESVASLKDRLEEAMAPFARLGVPFRQLLRQGLLTPCCGLTPLRSAEAAERALELLAALSARVRERYL